MRRDRTRIENAPRVKKTASVTMVCLTVGDMLLEEATGALSVEEVEAGVAELDVAVIVGRESLNDSVVKL